MGRWCVTAKQLLSRIAFIYPPVMSLMSLLTDGGGRTGEKQHYECRECGKNLSAEVASCPDCGGDVAVFTF